MNPHRNSVAVAAITGRRNVEAIIGRLLFHLSRLLPLLFLTALALPTHTAHSTSSSPLPGVDTHGTGMSDLWQRHFNQGELFDPANPAHHPEADPDGDGWSNLKESIAGTDPFCGRPPEGLAVSYVTYLKDQEEAPTPEFPDGREIDLAIVSWDTVPGKIYTLKASPDLEAESWIEVAGPFYGSGMPEAVPLLLTDGAGETAPRLFWRLRIEDVDSDGDGLTDYEEWLLGTNPWSPDTSGDGIPDGWLAIHGLNPSDHHGSIYFPGYEITAVAAYLAGVQAHPNATPDDLDGDGIPNHLDAHPESKEVDWFRAPETRYAAIEIPTPENGSENGVGNATALSDHGHAIFNRGVWFNGGWLEFAHTGSQSVTGENLYGDMHTVDIEWDLQYLIGVDSEGNLIGVAYPNGSSSTYQLGVWWENTGTLTAPAYAAPVLIRPDLILQIQNYEDLMFTPHFVGRDGTIAIKNRLPQYALVWGCSWANKNPSGNGFMFFGSNEQTHPHNGPLLDGEHRSWLEVENIAAPHSIYIGDLHVTGRIQGDEAYKMVLENMYGYPRKMVKLPNGRVMDATLENGQRDPTKDRLALTITPDDPHGNHWWVNDFPENDHAADDRIVLENAAGKLVFGPLEGKLPIIDSDAGFPVSDLNALGEAFHNGLIWRNGKVTSLSDLLPANHGYSDIRVAATNDKGMILAKVKKGNEWRHALLLPIDLAVDANRDGEVRFDGSDRTSAERPFHFWLNSNSDFGNDAAAKDKDPTSPDFVPDSSKAYIDSLRDLEDFTQLSLYAGAISPLVRSNAVKIGFRFIDVTTEEETPRIRIYRAVGQGHNAPDFEGDRYLYCLEAANSQMALTNAIGSFDTGESELDTIPKNYFDGLLWPKIDVDNPYIHFIFEGLSAGEGTLAIVIKDQDENETEVPLVHMKLTEINEMYEHWTVGDVVEIDVADIPAHATRTPDSGEYDSDSPEEDKCIVFVHGWRMLEWERRYFANTAYKRLWHQGYMGRFVFFSWPTEYTERWEDGWWGLFDILNNPPKDKSNYANSERKAYISGTGLRNLLLDLRGQHGVMNVSMFAHSMGNIVASEALRIHASESGSGRLINTYIACQSSMAAHAYDADLGERTPSTLLNLGPMWKTPEYYAANPYTGQPYFSNITNATRFVNFYNPEDSALGGWRHGQDLKPNNGMIPQITPNNNYWCNFPRLPLDPLPFYNPALIGELCYYWSIASQPLSDRRDLSVMDDIYEIYSYCVQARSVALGIVSLDSLDATDFNLNQDFTDELQHFTETREDHSAQFLGVNMIRYEFWEKLLSEFELD